MKQSLDLTVDNSYFLYLYCKIMVDLNQGQKLRDYLEEIAQTTDNDFFVQKNLCDFYRLQLNERIVY